MRRRNATFLFLTMMTASMAGCAGSGGFSGPGGFDADDLAFIRGIVVDPEFVPVAAATVSTSDGDVHNTTDDQGRFQLGPLAPGEHYVAVEKAGYAAAEVRIQLASDAMDPVSIMIDPIAADVPYHLSVPYTTYVNCASHNPIGGVPCTKLADYVLGTNISGEEKFAFTFQIGSPGLADMLVEMVWTAQQFGKDMSFKIQTPPNQPLTAAATQYFGMSGGPPLRGWVIANVANQDRDAVFDAEPGKITYEGMTIWSGNNGTVPGVPGYLSGTSLYLNHRTETWLTFFHNRPGSRDFSALPDE